MMPTPTLDFWYDFSSPYSYLAAHRIGALAKHAGVQIGWRPLLLGPIFKAQGMATSPFNLYPVKARYMWREMEREAAALGIGFRVPEPFPQNSILAARLALVGLDEEWGEDFTRAAYKALFAEGRPIADGTVMADVLRALAVDPDAALARAQSDAIKLKLRNETDEAQRRGIFGAPSFITGDGELFWGNDRLEKALDWAVRHAR